jgi:uncharacterized protein YdeI (YjbR/CyaY-like superfamily)
VLGLDRRPEPQRRRELLAAEVHAAWPSQHLVEAQSRLEAAGAMQPPGAAEVERAKADGRWEAAYDSPSTATVPDDLAAALAKNKKAREFFAKLSGSDRFAILFRLQTAKRADTRVRRIETFVAMLARGETIHPVKAAASARATTTARSAKAPGRAVKVKGSR